MGEQASSSSISNHLFCNVRFLILLSCSCCWIFSSSLTTAAFQIPIVMPQGHHNQHHNRLHPQHLYIDCGYSSSNRKKKKKQQQPILYQYSSVTSVLLLSSNQEEEEIQQQQQRLEEEEEEDNNNKRKKKNYNHHSSSFYPWRYRIIKYYPPYSSSSSSSSCIDDDVASSSSSSTSHNIITSSDTNTTDDDDDDDNKTIILQHHHELLLPRVLKQIDSFEFPTISKAKKSCQLGRIIIFRKRRKQQQQLRNNNQNSTLLVKLGQGLDDTSSIPPCNILYENWNDFVLEMMNSSSGILAPPITTDSLEEEEDDNEERYITTNITTSQQFLTSYDLLLGQSTTSVLSGDIIAIQTRIADQYYPPTLTKYIMPHCLPPGISTLFHDSSSSSSSSKSKIRSSSSSVVVVYEDDVIAIINKPENITTIGGSTGGSGSATDEQHSTDLKSMLGFCLKYPKTSSQKIVDRLPLPIHRLDRRTSGLVLCGKTKLSMTYLSKAFAQRNIQKSYIALVFHPPSTSSTTSTSDRPNNANTHWNTIDYDIDGKSSQSDWRIMATAIIKIGSSDKNNNYRKDDSNNNTITSHHHQQQQHNSTNNDDTPKKNVYQKVIDDNDNNNSNECNISCRLSLLEVRPHTGRYHQIRRHLAYCLGWPIVGDSKYDKGSPIAKQLRTNGMYLCCQSLDFPYPMTTTTPATTGGEGSSSSLFESFGRTSNGKEIGLKLNIRVEEEEEEGYVSITANDDISHHHHIAATPTTTTTPDNNKHDGAATTTTKVNHEEEEEQEEESVSSISIKRYLDEQGYPRMKVTVPLPYKFQELMNK